MHVAVRSESSSRIVPTGSHHCGDHCQLYVLDEQTLVDQSRLDEESVLIAPMEGGFVELSIPWCTNRGGTMVSKGQCVKAL